MTDLLSTFYGDVPGVLLRGSPVVYIDARQGVVVSIVNDRASVGWRGWPGRISDERADALRLDLTDKSARAHLAWWIVARLGDPGVNPESWFEARRICDLAEMNRSMTPQQIDTLARLGLRLANRSTT